MNSDERGNRHRYQFGSVVYDEARQELYVRQLPVQVEPRSLAVLAMLLRNEGRCFSSDELIAAAWGEEPQGTVPEDAVAQAIRELRLALSEENRHHIVVVPGKGYCFDSGQTAVQRSGLAPRQELTPPAARVLDLRPGQPVPHRSHLVLQHLMAKSGGSEVWLARSLADGEPRVLKLATDALRLATIRRQRTLHRRLQEGLGERADIIRIHSENLTTPPFFLECQHGGQNLADWAAEEDRLGQMATPARLALFVSIAEGVRAAHSVGVLHGALRPGNILIAREPGRWRVRLADFSGRRLLTAADGKGDPLGRALTQQSDTAYGRVVYAAPELRGGRPATQRSDVYALGLLLYQLLIADLGRTLAPGWRRDVRDDVLCAQIAGATHAHPAQRTPTVEDMIGRLCFHFPLLTARVPERLALPPPTSRKG